MQIDIFKKIEKAPKVDFGEILTRSFELFKNVWVQGIFHGLLTMAVVIPFILLIYLPFIPMYVEAFTPSIDGTYYEPTIDFTTPQIIGYVVLIIVFLFIMQLLTIVIVSHFYQVCKRGDTGTPETVGGYFVYLKYWKKIMVLSLATFGIALLAMMLCYFPLFYVIVPLQLLVPIFAFNPKLSVSDIIKASFKLGNKFWFILFGIIIVSNLIAQLGIVLCFIGVIVTAYFVHIPVYYFYKDTIGFEETNSVDLDDVTF